MSDGLFSGGGFRARAWKTLACVLLTAWLAALPLAIGSAPVQAQATAPPAATQHRAVLDRYCVSCHNEAAKSRGSVPMALDRLDLANVGANAAVWEPAVRKLRAGLMPPAGAPRPDKATHDALASWLEGELDRYASSRPNPGRTEPLHRLNRTEYRNAIRDLLELDIDVSSLLPSDDSSYGFDNIAGVLKLSPTLLERYLNAAQKVSRLAVGAAAPSPSIDYFRVADDRAQDVQLPDMPAGTRGGTRIPVRVSAGWGLRDSRATGARSQRERADLQRGAACRGQHRRRACRYVHAAGRRHAGDCRPPGAGRGIAVAGPAGAAADLPDSADGACDGEGARGAQQGGRRLEPPRAGPRRTTRRRRHLHQPYVRARRDDAAAVPAPVSGGGEHP